MQEIYLAGGCLWGVQEFFRHVPGVVATEAGRANGTEQSTAAAYDGYAECVRIQFNTNEQSLSGLLEEFFTIIDPYSINRQGSDIGRKYRTGIYSQSIEHLKLAYAFIKNRSDADRIVIEVLPLSNFVKSDPEHQDRLHRCPNDYCHIEPLLMNKYKV